MLNDSRLEVSELCNIISDELHLYRVYLDTLGKISGLLLQGVDGQTWAEVLALLGETTATCHCALFFNDPTAAHPRANLVSTWSVSGSSSTLDDFTFRSIEYERYPLLSDTLHVGMVLAKDRGELPLAEQSLFRTPGVASLLCIPLLISGELVGFLAFFSPHQKRRWLPVENNVLCVIANDIALTLARTNVERTLKTSESRLRVLVGATEDVVMEIDAAGVIVNVWAPHHSLPITLDHNLVGQKLSVLPQHMADALGDAVHSVLNKLKSESIEFALTFADGNRYFIGRIEPVPSESSSREHNAVALIRDVSAIMREEVQRKAMLQTLDLLDEAIIDLSVNGRLIAVTAAWHKLRGQRSANDGVPFDQPLANFVHHDDRFTVESVLESLMTRDQQVVVIRFRLQQISGEFVWIEARLLPHLSLHGEIVSIRGVLRDITSAYMQEKRITQMALHDALTQLPNRILLEEHLQQAIARAQRSQGKVALGFIDLDHFKRINDTLGHKAGDQVLLTLSQRLQSVLREIDTLSRWGGDEFVVLLPDATRETDFRAIAERLREAARRSINVDGIEAQLTISIGFAIYPDDADNAENLMSIADHTMFQAKSIGRNNVQFAHDMERRSPDREDVLLQARLARAVQEKALQVFYLPIVDVRNGSVVAAEALARWYDEQAGWVSPTVFIPMAEHLGMIQELGEQILDHVLQRLQAWRAAGHTLRLAVNMSRAQLFTPDVVEWLKTKASAYGLVPQDLIIEITESVALLDATYESKRLNQLVAAGFELAIDDFGTGYSALSQLHEMPVKILKIDGSFTSRLQTEHGRRIVQAIVQMADGLNLGLVVEGVETRESAEYLQTLGVRYMQGVYFSEAIPAGMCEMMIQRGSNDASDFQLESPRSSVLIRGVG